jgi:general secretion pathway protein G
MTHALVRQSDGYGLLELIIAMVVTALLSALAVPAYNGAVARAKVARAIGEIGALSAEIDRFSRDNNDQFPAALSDLPVNIPVDPWGNQYQYLNIRAAGSGKGLYRKDGKLDRLNSDFDLFSAGKDGATASPLSAMRSRDDIVRANNGAFVGLGEDY